MLQLQSAFGILALLAIAWGLGENRRAVSLRQMAVGLAVTVVTALVLIKAAAGCKGVRQHQRCRQHHFGGPPALRPAPPSCSVISAAAPCPSISRRRVLIHPGISGVPIILVMSVLTTLLFYWRILPPIVRGMAWFLERTLGVGGPRSVCRRPPISFSAWSRRPLFIRPYLAQLTRSELFW